MYFLITFLVSCVLTYSVHGAANCGASGTENCKLRCQNTTLTSGAPTAIATACADTRTDCGVLFNCSTDTKPCDPLTYALFNISDPATYPKYRPLLCDLDSMQDIALECAKTCQICCETPAYNCLDDDSGVIDCAGNKGKCLDSNWTDVMASYCPQTCGLCANGTCRDLNSGCAGLASLCRDIDFYTYMTANCARTCDACSSSNSSSSTTGSCVDVASNCATNKGLCTNPVYATLMKQQCCSTCAASSSTASTCIDTATTCSNWVSNGFCNSTFYSAAEKTQYCAKSCNLC